jgi:predicted site-specific integrase-resolvase
MADSMTTDTLTPRQWKALGALLVAPSIRQAAADADVPEKTLHNWLKNGKFEVAYREARREAVRQSTARAQSAASAMVAVMIRIAVKDTARDADRISAASKVYDIAFKGVELEDLRNELEQLQALIRERLSDADL